MIKVLQVLGGLNRGGAETMIMNLYRAIDRTKFQFDFVIHTDKTQEYANEVLNLGGKIYVCPKYNGKNHFAYCKWWKQFYKNHPEYKIVHGHMRSTAAIFLSIAKQYGLKTISHSHSVSSGTGFSSFVKNLLQLPIRNIADFFMGCSREANEWLFGKKIANSDKCIILNNAIDTSLYDYNSETREKIRSSWNISDEFVVGTVGRITEPKNPCFLIEVFRDLKVINPNAKLVIAGDGDMMPIVKERIKEFELENDSILLGSCDNVPEVLQGLDVFVFPSLWEGLGMAAIEAQAAGLVTICSERIPKAVFVTDLARSLELSSGSKNWAEYINESQIYERNSNYAKLVFDAEYDISKTSEILSSIYSEIWRM